MGQTTVTINGKLYDAKTGQLIKKDTTATAHTAVKSVDGVAKKPSRTQTHHHSVHHKTQKSQTLMRNSVKKPHAQKVKKVNHNTHAATSTHAAKKSQPIINHARSQRAEHVQKSSLISRFGQTHNETNVHKKTSHLPVKKAPHISSTHTTAPLPQHKNIENPFANAIDAATSHEAPKLKKTTKRHKIAKALKVSPKTVSAASFVLSGMLIGGFFFYQNIPAMSVRMAAARSGVDARMPAYQPSGFAMSGPIEYSPGKISINYTSNSDERSFAITQTTSAWNSDALLENYVAINDRPYQTLVDNGRVIYMYDDSSASWVEDGVWYQIEGKSSLNSNQLLRIANSL